MAVRTNSPWVAVWVHADVSGAALDQIPAVAGPAVYSMTSAIAACSDNPN